MYILTNHSGIILGLFTSIEQMNQAISVINEHGDTRKLYYTKVIENVFDNKLTDFFTMHTENLIEIDGYLK